MWVCHSYPVEAYVVVITESEEGFAGELTIVVGDDIISYVD